MTKLDPYADWRQLLSDHFAARPADEDARLWQRVRESFGVGQRVRGIVVAKAHFGAWVDVGVGFPALLEIIHIDGPTPERYRADEWCPIGSEITATIAAFGDSSHQIRLLQVDRR